MSKQPPDANVIPSRVHAVPLDDLPPLGMDVRSLSDDFRRHFAGTLGPDSEARSAHYCYNSLVWTLRDRLAERWKRNRLADQDMTTRRCYYLSMEFLIGRSLNNAMLSLGVRDAMGEMLSRLGLSLEELLDHEHDAGLGNGGLGRLAACFLDSCATMGLPVRGYGLRYQYGMFRQCIENGEQVEEPDHWLRDGNPWELERPEYTRRIHFGGRTESYRDKNDRTHVRWVDTQDVLAVPYDLPIPGFDNERVNTLRLWAAEATDEFNLGEFNAGSYPESVELKNAAENITMVLYPNDASENGKELRLRQQYLLVSASLQDVLDHWRRAHHRDLRSFSATNVFQLNDTHPGCAVPELMRLLVDENGLEWDEAWAITHGTMAYTNHTLLPEALERWPVRLFQRLLPRLLEIIVEINRRFLNEVEERWPDDSDRRNRMSIIEDGSEPMVRMAYLAIVGSFSVNGVAALHSRLLTEGLFRDFFELWPEKFNNKTNGVTPRRWLYGCNPGLRKLLDESIGAGWILDLDQLRDLEPFAEDSGFRERWLGVKRANKRRLAELVLDTTDVEFPVEFMFDVQVKRIHEYKRQLLNVLHAIHLYDRIERGETGGWVPRCILIAGKAAPGYLRAKEIIRLACKVADVINGDPRTRGMLRMVFLPDYRVSVMEVVCPGTDLSEQISTAGKEASGTGNMKFMMNGAVTIGSLDGANIEILEAVGEENFFRFGLTASEVEHQLPVYDPSEVIANDPDLERVMGLLERGRFNGDEPALFDGVIASIRQPGDPWMVAADFTSYVVAQRRVAAAYRDPNAWSRMSILNTARSGRFSADRTIEQYNRDVWHLTPTSAGV
jgi:starch phosphorylase